MTVVKAINEGSKLKLGAKEALEAGIVSGVHPTLEKLPAARAYSEEQREELYKSLTKDKGLTLRKEEINCLLSAVEHLGTEKQKELLKTLSKQEGFLYSAGKLHEGEKGTEDAVKEYQRIKAQREVLEAVLTKSINKPEELESIINSRRENYHQGLTEYSKKVEENIQRHKAAEEKRLNEMGFVRRTAEQMYNAAVPAAMDVAEILCLSAVSLLGLASEAINIATLYQFKDRYGWNTIVHAGIEKVSYIFNNISPLGSLVTRKDGLSTDSTWQMITTPIWAGLLAGKAVSSVAFSAIMAGVDNCRVELGMRSKGLSFSEFLAKQETDEDLKLQKDSFYLLATLGLSFLSVRNLKAANASAAVNTLNASRISKLLKNPWVQVMAPSVGMSGAAALGEELLNIGTEKEFNARNLLSNIIYGTANSQVFMASLQGVGYCYVKCRSGLSASSLGSHINSNTVSKLEAESLNKYFKFSQKYNAFRTYVDLSDGLSDVWDVLTNDISKVGLNSQELNTLTKALRSIGFALKFGSALYDTKDINEALGDSSSAQKNIIDSSSIKNRNDDSGESPSFKATNRLPKLPSGHINRLDFPKNEELVLAGVIPDTDSFQAQLGLPPPIMFMSPNNTSNDIGYGGDSGGEYGNENFQSSFNNQQGNNSHYFDFETIKVKQNNLVAQFIALSPEEKVKFNLKQLLEPSFLRKDLIDSFALAVEYFLEKRDFNSVKELVFNFGFACDNQNAHLMLHDKIQLKVLYKMNQCLKEQTHLIEIIDFTTAFYLAPQKFIANLAILNFNNAILDNITLPNNFSSDDAYGYYQKEYQFKEVIEFLRIADNITTLFKELLEIIESHGFNDIKELNLNKIFKKINKVIKQIDNNSDLSKFIFAQCFMQIPEFKELIERKSLLELNSINEVSLDKLFADIKDNFLIYTFLSNIRDDYEFSEDDYETEEEDYDDNDFEEEQEDSNFGEMQVEAIDSHSIEESSEKNTAHFDTLLEILKQTSKEKYLNTVIKIVKKEIFSGNDDFAVRIIENALMDDPENEAKYEELLEQIGEAQTSFDYLEEHIFSLDLNKKPLTVSITKVTEQLKDKINKNPKVFPWLRLMLLANPGTRTLIQEESLNTIERLANFINQNPTIWLSYYKAPTSENSSSQQNNKVEMEVNGVKGYSIASNSEKILIVNSILLLREIYKNCRTTLLLHETSNQISYEDAKSIAENEAENVTAFFHPLMNRMVFVENNKSATPNLETAAFRAIHGAHEHGHLEIENARKNGAIISYEDEELYCWKLGLAKARDLGIELSIKGDQVEFLIVEPQIDALLRNILISQERAKENKSSEDYTKFLEGLKIKYSNDRIALEKIKAILENDLEACRKLMQYNAQIPSDEQLRTFIRRTYNLGYRPIASLSPESAETTIRGQIKINSPQASSMLITNLAANFAENKTALLNCLLILFTETNSSFLRSCFISNNAFSILANTLHQSLIDQDPEIKIKAIQLISRILRQTDPLLLEKSNELIFNNPLVSVHFDLAIKSFNQKIISKLANRSISAIESAIFEASKVYPLLLEHFEIDHLLKTMLTGIFNTLIIALDSSYSENKSITKIRILKIIKDIKIIFNSDKIQSSQRSLLINLLKDKILACKFQVDLIKDLFLSTNLFALSELHNNKDFQNFLIYVFEKCSLSEKSTFPLTLFAPASLEGIQNNISSSLLDIINQKSTISVLQNFIFNLYNASPIICQNNLDRYASEIANYIQEKISDPFELIKFVQFTYGLRIQNQANIKQFVFLLETILLKHKISIQEECKKHYDHSEFCKEMEKESIRLFLSKKDTFAKFLFAAMYDESFAGKLKVIEPRMKKFIQKAKGEISKHAVDELLEQFVNKSQIAPLDRPDALIVDNLIAWQNKKIQDQDLINLLYKFSYLGLIAKLLQPSFEEANQILKNFIEKPEFAKYQDVFFRTISTFLFSESKENEFQDLNSFQKHYKKNHERILLLLTTTSFNDEPIDSGPIDLTNFAQTTRIISFFQQGQLTEAVNLAQNIIKFTCQKQNSSNGYDYILNQHVQEHAFEAFFDELSKHNISTATTLFVTFNLESLLLQNDPHFRNYFRGLLIKQIRNENWRCLDTLYKLISNKRLSKELLPSGYDIRNRTAILAYFVYSDEIQDELSVKFYAEVNNASFRIPTYLITKKSLESAMKLKEILKELKNLDRYPNKLFDFIQNFIINTNDESRAYIINMLQDEALVSSLVGNLTPNILSTTELIYFVAIAAELSYLEYDLYIKDSKFTSAIHDKVRQLVEAFCINNSTDQKAIEEFFQSLEAIAKKSIRIRSPMQAKYIITTLMETSSYLRSQDYDVEFLIKTNSIENIEVILERFYNCLELFDSNGAVLALQDLMKLDKDYDPYIKSFLFGNNKIKELLFSLFPEYRKDNGDTPLPLASILRNIQENPFNWFEAVCLP